MSKKISRASSGMTQKSSARKKKMWSNPSAGMLFVIILFLFGVVGMVAMLVSYNFQIRSQAQILPPPPPGATLTLTADPTGVPSGGSSTLTWSSTNMTSCTASGGWSGSKDTKGTQTITNITATTTYTLTCVGFSVGNVVRSATVTLLDTTPPLISAISAGGLTQTQATINWTTNEPSDSQVEYGLTTSYGSSTTLNTSMVTAHSVAVAGLSAGKVYHYRVKSKDAAGNQAVSGDNTFATPDTTPPSAPQNLQGQAISDTQNHLTWSVSTDNVGVTGYRVERCQGSTCTNFLQIGTPTNAVFDDISLLARTTYQYRVRSVDAAGNLSPYSLTISVTTKDPPPVACSTYTTPTPSSFAAGFAVPWDVLVTGNPLLAKAECASFSSTVILTAGRGVSSQYVWHESYYTRDGQQWEPKVELQGIPSNAPTWFIGSAATTQTGLNLSLQNFFVSYVCTWTGTEWKCGCRDQATCTANGLWNLQGFKL